DYYCQVWDSSTYHGLF
nr:immunoglobulin light chain junction region [Macaca mulatta]MOY14949.1 immunoglobulin light chain junction region [Macaca mulatta]MOY15091.1 immunoglobulin light chain junction region [Macaca mulatta]MOY15116.1 immunoglobulin light chain junction region [Macaca mulatta]MOY15471.1 immunoglobulin light chain junction region [Macaca mulatta]